jgi:DNA processing protein
MSFDTILPLAVHRAGFLKPKEKLLLGEVLESSEHLQHFTVRELERTIGRRLKRAVWNPQTLLADAESDARYLGKHGFSWITYWSPQYPVLLREIYDSPYVLYIRGNLPAQQTALLSVVGTREPTGKAKQAAFRLGFEAAGSGVGVVSGLAKGIDGAAHRGALSGKGSTIAVLGSGIDGIYPSTNKKLAVRILQSGGCIISEYPPGTPPRRHNFPARNRIISGMSQVTAVIQCPERSGALITADYALDQGRELVVHHDGIHGYAGGGTRKLAESGAQLINGLGDLSGNMQSRYTGSAENDYIEQRDTGRIMAALLEKELAGEISRYYGEYYGSL